MASFSEIFTQVPAYRIAVCREHKSAVTAGSVASHVNTQHRHMATKTRQQVVQEALGLQAQGILAADIREVRFPDEVVPAIPDLPVATDGKKCTRCGYIRRNKAHIQMHCRDEHGWVNPRGRGGKPGAQPPGGVGEAWVDGVHCQRFGQTGAMQRLFEVAAPAGQTAGSGDANSTGESGGMQEAIKTAFQAVVRTVQQADKEAAALIHEQSRWSANQWVRRTGWARHLHGFDREWLATTVKAPVPGQQRKGADDEEERDEKLEKEEAESEGALAVAVLAIERLVWRAQKASRAEVVGSAAVHFIERREAGGESNEKPFNAGQKGQTMERYVEAWKSIVAYIWRTYGLAVGHAGEEGADGSPGGNPGGDPDNNPDDRRGRRADGQQGRHQGRQADGRRDGGGDKRSGGIRNKRPAYQFTEEQAGAFEAVRKAAYAAAAAAPREDVGSAKTDTLERHALSFFVALLDHDIQDNEYQNALFSGLAVLGIQPGHGWRSALIYTPTLSAVVTVAKMLVLYQAQQTREDEIRQRCEATGESREEAQGKVAGHFPRVQQMVQRFMTIVAYEGRPTPMDSILRLRAYGKAIRANTNADGVVDWHGDTLLYGSVQFSMASLRTMLHGLLHTARAQLRREVLLVETDEEGGLAARAALPTIQWERLVDDAAETKAGWNFVEDPRNRAALGSGSVDGKGWLLRRVAEEPELQRAFIAEAGPEAAGPEAGPPGPGGGEPGTRTGPGEVVRWRMERVRQYSEAMKAFRAQLFVLMHMSGGQPARGTELITVQHKNGAEGDIRGLFIESGLVAFVTMYSKTMGMSAKAKVIYRYLPREVGELVVYYVWLAIPFWRIMVSSASGGQADGGSAYIWEPRPDEAWAFPGGKRGADAVGGGQGPSRAAARLRGRTGARAAGDGSEAESGTGRNPSPGPSGGRSKEWWEAEQWDTGRASRAMARVSLTHVGEKITLMTWRHSVKAIYRRFIRDRSVIEMMENADTAEGEEEEGTDKTGVAVGNAFHAQSGHSTRIGEGIYGRSMNESLYSTEARRIMFRKASREWHAFCMFDSVVRGGFGSGGGGEGRPSRLGDITRQATEEEDRRWRAMRQVDLGAQLRRMIGEGAEFRGVQGAALQAIMRQASPIVVVMGTGGGKSMLFMLPAACSHGGLTVVVVPLVSLRSDIKDRCDELGIECVEWNAGRPYEWASVVLVTPESAVGESFGHFINRQRAMGRLDRIVVDECHVVLDSGAGGSWRTRVLGLRGLVKAETQLLYLTATLRPADEAEFGRLMGLPETGTHWFRAATSRRNVEYQVLRFDPGKEEEEEVVAELVEAKKRKYGSRGQIIVYCDTVQKTVKYGKRLGGVCYHRKVGSSDEKREIVRQLREGRQQVFTATNALGLGVDVPTIRVVIHVGTVRRLRDYAQESGRAGRDGAASEAIIVRAERYDGRGRAVRETAEQAGARGVEKAMWEFCETTGCVRAVLDREMDGREGREGCEEGEEACYRCRKRGGRRWEEEERSGDAVEEKEEDGGEVNAGGTVEGTGKKADRGGNTKGVEEAGTEEAEAAEAEVNAEIYEGRARRRMYGWQERRRQGDEAGQAVRLEEIMEQWSVGCGWCRAKKRGEEKSRGHELESCETEGAKEVAKSVEWVREGIRWEAYSGCFDCGMPQSICAKFEETGGSGKYRRIKDGRCQYGGTLVETTVSLWLAQEEEAEGWFKEEIKRRGMGWEGNIKQVMGWMGRKVRWGGLESNEMCRTVVKLHRVWESSK